MVVELITFIVQSLYRTEHNRTEEHRTLEHK